MGEQSFDNAPTFPVTFLDHIGFRTRLERWAFEKIIAIHDDVRHVPGWVQLVAQHPERVLVRYDEPTRRIYERRGEFVDPTCIPEVLRVVVAYEWNSRARKAEGTVLTAMGRGHDHVRENRQGEVVVWPVGSKPCWCHESEG